MQTFDCIMGRSHNIYYIDEHTIKYILSSQVNLIVIKTTLDIVNLELYLGQLLLKNY